VPGRHPRAASHRRPAAVLNLLRGELPGRSGGQRRTHAGHDRIEEHAPERPTRHTKVAGLTGGAFAAQEHAGDEAVVLAHDSRHAEGETWTTIEDATELRSALFLEKELFDENVSLLKADDPDFVGKLSRLNDESVEAYATVLERIDQSSRKYNWEQFNEVWATTLDLPLRNRITNFVSSWRVASNDDGTFTVLRGVHITGNEYSYDDREAAEYRLEQQLARDARATAYPKLSTYDERWDAEMEEDAINVSSVNPWFGMVRFERTGGDDVVLVDEAEMLDKTNEIMEHDTSRLLNLGPDVLAEGGDRAALAARIAQTPSLFGTFIGANGDSEVIPTTDGSVVRVYNIP
jgi:hypothetical protein